MNKQAKISGRQTLAGIKSLRAYDTESKPVYVKVLAALGEAMALVGRMATCKIENSYQFAATTQGKTEQRMMLNDFGKWAPAK